MRTVEQERRALIARLLAGAIGLLIGLPAYLLFAWVFLDLVMRVADVNNIFGVAIALMLAIAATISVMWAPCKWVSDRFYSTPKPDDSQGPWSGLL